MARIGLEFGPSKCRIPSRHAAPRDRFSRLPPPLPGAMSLRHERRRRMLADENLNGGELASAAEQLATQRGDTDANAAYATTVDNDCGRRVIDLLPHGRAALSLTILSALAAVGLLAAVDTWADTIGTFLGDSELPALRLDSQASAGGWLATILLAGCAPLAWLIYSLRRHRVDDYNGRYRVWLWIGAACLLGSMLQGSDLGQVLQAVCRRACAVCSLDAALVWKGSGALLLGAAALRLLVEVRHSRPAIVAWAASGAAFLLSPAMGLTWLEGAVETFPPAARVSWLIGYVFLWATFLVYVRFVRLQIEGVVAPPKRVRKPRVKPAPAERGEAPAKPRPALQLRTDLDPPPDPAPAATARPALSPSSTHEDADDDSSTLSVQSHSGNGLSRAERRRMRRQTRGAA